MHFSVSLPPSLLTPPLLGVDLLIACDLVSEHYSWGR